MARTPLVIVIRLAVAIVSIMLALATTVQTEAKRYGLSIDSAPVVRGGSAEARQERDVSSDGFRVTPKRIVATLNAGATHRAQVSVFTGDSPFNKGDVMFVFDRTGSMSEEISEVKRSAIRIMDEVRNQLPNTWFGVASFMDYPNYYSYSGYSAWYGSSSAGDVPWELNLYPTDDIASVSNAIRALSLGDGRDEPEDYTRVLYELSHIEPVIWRSNAKRVVVLFGDAPTHDLNFAGYNFGGDPGRDGVAQTADDLDFETVVAQVRSKNISVIAVDSGGTRKSEATFKGMSTGYAGAPGTNGRYFRLTNAADIPQATVDLIRAETQVIDRLSLRVTEGYEGWVRISPEEYIGVTAGVTKTFSISLTVPTDTAPGYYPFVLQAIGDGAILGLTYVEIAVPNSSPISDLSFRPNPDGFSFENFGTTQTWEMFEQFFGTDQVEYPNGNRIHAADAFYRKYYRSAGEGGSCDGFSATSLFNYKRLSQPNAGTFAMPNHVPLYPQAKTEQIEEAIAFAQGIQMGVELSHHRQLMCEVLGNSPAAFYRYLKSVLQNGTPAVIGIMWTRDYSAYIPPITVLKAGGGHALVPYRFEESPSTDRAFVYVYDSNQPGNNLRRIEFDLMSDRWSYKWPVPLWPDITIGGDPSSCSISVEPLEIYRHRGISWWSRATEKAAPPRPLGLGTPQVFMTSGPARLLFVDDEGRRLGWDGEQFYAEIPQAIYVPVRNSGTAPQRGFYIVPTELLYELSARGVGAGPVSVSVLSEGHFASLSATGVVTNTLLGLRVPRSVNEIAVVDSNALVTVDLSVSHLLTNEDRTTTVGDLVIGPHEAVKLRLNVDRTGSSGDTVEIETSSGQSRTYSLSLQRSGGAGYSSFGSGEIILDPTSKTVIRIQDWSAIPRVTLEIDTNGDNVADRRTVVENRAQPHSITIEASRKTIPIGGAQTKLVVAAKDQFGAYVADGEVVTLSASRGTLSLTRGTTVGGLVHAVLTSNDSPGPVTITARVGALETSLVIDFVDVAVRRTFLPLYLDAQGTLTLPTWQQGLGLTGRTAYGLSSTDTTCTTLFAATDNGAYRSTDAGQSWTPVPTFSAQTAFAPKVFDGIEAPSAALTPAVAVCPANPNIVYLTQWGGGVYRSGDGGATWQPRNAGLGDLWIYALAVHPSNCDVVYVAANERGVWQTTDGGASWSARNSGLGNLATRSIAIAPSNPNRVYVGTTAGIWRTDNGGTAWTATSGLPAAPARSLAVSRTNSDFVVAALDGAGVFITTNAGSSWQERNSGLPDRGARAVTLDPRNSQRVVVGLGYGGGVYTSDNGGSAWTAMNEGLGNRNVKALWQAGGACRRLYAGTTNGVWFTEP